MAPPKAKNANTRPPSSMSEPQEEPRPSVWRLSLLTLAIAASISYLLYTSSTTPSLDTQLHGDRAFEIQDLPGRGKGVIATRDIKQGELVIHEQPLFVSPRSFTQDDPRAFITEMLGSLNETSKEALFALSHPKLPSHIDPKKYPVETVFNIIQTNAVAAGPGDSVGVFPTMARLNHGCSSAFNVVYSFRHATNEIVVYALKDIAKGQELLTTYTNTRRPRSERRDYLSSFYEFHCTCAVCSLPEAESQASDRRLEAMTQLYSSLSTWATERISGSEAIDSIRQIWALGNEEGYWSERGQLAADAAQVACTHSDDAAARAWAALAGKWYSFELGNDTAEVRAMRDLVNEPRNAGSWGSRTAMDVGGPNAFW